MADRSDSADAPTGTTQLPAARVKRIIKEDSEIATCSADAVFLISVATEMFLKQTAQLSIQHAHREKRKTVAYKDVANLVAERENLEFLTGRCPHCDETFYSR
ncbi:histone-fold-containing protein [Thamnocephalis sphaerospora]|uniref:Histone-fold-containing protein n=1 Tax=Thamnocephalis sphaerospora TaxID=78915 RepID=A0A4P9XGN5_9FUNG|nr:histone-fold-containing protein [Thamnocephalis sphaerospora]|eukprot:RKP04806.1 histone-fold-containing protein [Thamnocephalis sphaerospora]